ncbi:MAG TPA: hypothetical protein VEW46_04810 [Pyrinomonadaceae bacterium]|nr:hypothetical protein [Pyrinomonadaceae bacterium]
MKRLVISIALCCALSSPALAGLIPSVPVAPPPPEDGAQITSSTAPGNIPTVGYTDQLPDATLNLIQIMVGLVV